MHSGMKAFAVINTKEHLMVQFGPGKNVAAVRILRLQPSDKKSGRKSLNFCERLVFAAENVNLYDEFAWWCEVQSPMRSLYTDNRMISFLFAPSSSCCDYDWGVNATENRPGARPVSLSDTSSRCEFAFLRVAAKIIWRIHNCRQNARREATYNDTSSPLSAFGHFKRYIPAYANVLVIFCTFAG